MSATVETIAMATTLALKEYVKSDNACILATRVFIEAAKHFGIRAKPRPVSVCVANEEAFSMMLRHKPVSEWPDGAWSVGTSEYASDVGYGFHLVATVKSLLVDPTVHQFARPTKGILIPRVPCIVPIGQWEPNTSLNVDINRATIMYSRVADSSYLEAPDWMNKDKYGPLVTWVIANVENW